MDLNKRIRELIDGYDNSPESYSIEDLKRSVIEYSECSDFKINDADLKVGLNKVYEYLGINELSKDVSCILTNSVNGKIANALLENIHIYCFDNDYYCSTASQIVNAEKNRKDKIEFLFGDISQFFTYDFGSNFVADFVITCPSENNHVYTHLDYEMKYREMNPYEYYTKRSVQFLQSGGISMSIVPTAVADFVRKKMTEFEVTTQNLGTLNFTEGYSFIYFKRI